MHQSCPINFQTYDNTISRISSLSVTMLLAVYLLTSQIGIILFVIADLVVRVFIDKRFSPLYHISVSLKRLFGLQSVIKDSASKRLATYFGILFSFLIVLFHLLHLQEALYITAGIYIICLLLDAFFDFCLGCKIYYLIKKVSPEFME